VLLFFEGGFFSAGMNAIYRGAGQRQGHEKQEVDAGVGAQELRYLRPENTDDKQNQVKQGKACKESQGFSNHDSLVSNANATREPGGEMICFLG